MCERSRYGRYGGRWVRGGGGEGRGREGERGGGGVGREGGGGGGWGGGGGGGGGGLGWGWGEDHKLRFCSSNRVGLQTANAHTRMLIHTFSAHTHTNTTIYILTQQLRWPGQAPETGPTSSATTCCSHKAPV